MNNKVSKIIKDRERFIRQYGEDAYKKALRQTMGNSAGGGSSDTKSTWKSGFGSSGKTSDKSTKIDTQIGGGSDNTFYTNQGNDGIMKNIHQYLAGLKQRVEEKGGDIDTIQRARDNLAVIAAGRYSNDDLVQLSELDGLIAQKAQERDEAMQEFVEKFRKITAAQGGADTTDNEIPPYVKPRANALDSEEAVHAEYNNMMAEMYGEDGGDSAGTPGGGGYHSPVSDTGNALQNNRPSFSVNDTRMIENLGSGDIGLDNEEEPEPLKLTDDYDDYIDYDDYDSYIDYCMEVENHVFEYMQREDEEGLEEFYDKNDIDFGLILTYLKDYLGEDEFNQYL
ncbi:MAG: hypothetical protein PHO15_10845, partial [Eubacteriales bacterium]|nr:hypothetical protein [Eubacteriales bacterium]